MLVTDSEEMSREESRGVLERLDVSSLLSDVPVVLPPPPKRLRRSRPSPRSSPERVDPDTVPPPPRPSQASSSSAIPGVSFPCCRDVPLLSEEPEPDLPSTSVVKERSVSPPVNRTWRLKAQIDPAKARFAHLLEDSTPADLLLAERHWRHKTFNPPLPAEPPPLSDRLLHAVSALSSEGSPFAVKQFLERTKGDWAARDQRLDKETRAWADAMAPSVHKVAGHLRLPVMSEMLKSFGYEDRQIVPDFRAGFRIQGRIRAANVFGRIFS